MIHNVHIQNLGLIKETQIQFKPGFSVITGETGAGKSFFMNAIKLGFGSRAKNKPTDDQTTIVEIEYDNQIFRRVLDQKRSRFFIDDEPASLEEGQNIFNSKIDLHSQHDNLFLKSPQAASTILDASLSDKEIKSNFTQKYKEFLQAQKTLQAYKNDLEVIGNQKDFWEFQLEKFKSIDFDLEDFEQAEMVVKTHKTQEENKQSTIEAIEALAGEEHSVLGMMSDAQRLIENFNPDLSAQLNNNFDQIQTIVKILENQLPEDNYEYQQALDLTQRAKTAQRQFNVFSFPDLIKQKQDLSEKLKHANSLAQEIQDQEDLVEKLNQKATKLAKDLSQARAKQIPVFNENITQKCRSLGMPPSVFEVQTTNAKLNPQGIETIEFYFSANQNQELSPLRNVASGGEMARVTLALKQFWPSDSTMIFDEIDTGVSGAIAEKMADEMKLLANDRQIIAITHLPQIAARASNHYIVEKTHHESHTQTYIKKLDHSERIEAIASMLSGDKITDQARDAAETLLNKN